MEKRAQQQQGQGQPAAHESKPKRVGNKFKQRASMKATPWLTCSRWRDPLLLGWALLCLSYLSEDESSYLETDVGRWDVLGGFMAISQAIPAKHV